MPQDRKEAPPSAAKAPGGPARGWQDETAWERQNNFDFLRFALATLVIFAHSFALLVGNDSTEPLMRLTGQQTFGALAVDGFFILSGFLVTQSWFRSKGAGDYLKKRARRIYPGFIVATLFCMFVVGPLAARDPLTPFHPQELLRAAWNIPALRGNFQRYVFLDNPFPHTANGSVWSIPYEAWCYVGVMLLAVLAWIKRKPMLAIFALSIAVSATFDILHLENSGTRLADGGRLGPIIGGPPEWARLLPFYLAGMIFYVYRPVLPFSARWAVVSAVALVLGGWWSHGFVFTLPTAGAYLLFWAAFHPGLRLSRWAKYGDFSYGIYLYAFPIQQLLVMFFPRIQPLALFAAATPLAILAGVASWHLVEKHFLKRRRIPATAPAVAATAS
jgi:peptidoglycan/LPS O-acetylase OafA/YrhL